MAGGSGVSVILTWMREYQGLLEWPGGASHSILLSHH
jgi:hypothetical protein